ncbi:MAG: hypothetical protein HQK52_12420 [Oligoflexia bacterium]|nr:hypothetical protein [Oligoflexia bacterium]
MPQWIAHLDDGMNFNEQGYDKTGRNRKGHTKAQMQIVEKVIVRTQRNFLKDKMVQETKKQAIEFEKRGRYFEAHIGRHQCWDDVC